MNSQISLLRGIMHQARILIVEDEAITAFDLETMLAHKGFLITGIAASGEEAIRLARETSPDVILMDIHLKGAMNGAQAAVAIETQNDPKPAILFLSAFSISNFPAVKETGRFLPKPVNADDLTDMIEGMLEEGRPS